MSLHPHVAGLLPTLDPAWRRKIFRGGLVLCIPVVGWPAVLGYRARFVRHLFGPTPAALPDWGEGFLGFVRDGLLAMAVIFGYLAPLYLVAALTVLARGFVPGATSLWLALAFLAFPIFSTLSFPLACVLLAAGEPTWLGTGECAGLLAGYALLIFLVPAGFLQVTRTGRHRSAFAVWRTLPFVWRHLRAYGRAWWCSCLMSLVGHLALPLAPWGVVWCYLGILALFNEVLHVGGLAPGEGWLQRALTDPRFVRQRRGWTAELRDGAGARVTALDLGLFSVPLPRVRRRA